MNENEAVGEVIEAITTQPDVVVVEALEAIRSLFLGSMGIFIKIGMVLLVMVIAKKLITTFIDNLFHNKLLTNAECCGIL